MGKTGRKSKLIPVLILLIAALLLVDGTLLLTERKIASLQHSAAELPQKTAALQEKLQEDTLALKQLQEESEKMDHLDEAAEEKKAEFFRHAKELEDKVRNGESDVKIAYLTFDDGPYRDTTGTFLDILQQYDILATFFYLEKDGRDDLYQRVIDSGHTLANHTASHDLSSGGIYRSVDTFIADVQENRSFIQDRFGYTTTILRFPGGSSQARDLKGPIVERLREMGYGYVDWDTTTGDGRNSGTVEEYIHGVLDVSADYSINVVLMHDYSVNTHKALPTIIEGMQEQGYIFLPLFYDSYKIKK